MTLVRALASYLVDFYNPPKTKRTAHRRKSFKSKGIPKLVETSKKKWKSRKNEGVIQVLLKSQNSLNTYPRGENQRKSVLEILFENYAKKYGTENFTIRNWADFQNYKDKTLDSVIAVTTAKFALFNIQSVMDLTKKIPLI